MEKEHYKYHSILHDTPTQVSTQDNQRLREATPLKIYNTFLQETERTVDKRGYFIFAGRTIKVGTAVVGKRLWCVMTLTTCQWTAPGTGRSDEEGRTDRKHQ